MFQLATAGVDRAVNSPDNDSLDIGHSDRERAIAVSMWLFEGSLLRTGKLRKNTETGETEVLLDRLDDKIGPRVVQLRDVNQFSHIIAQTVIERELQFCREAIAHGWPIAIIGRWLDNPE